MRTQHDKHDREARAPRVPRTEAPAVDAAALARRAGPRPDDRLAPGEVFQLQRSAGNAAVGRRLGQQRSTITLQRSKESEELLTKLATPKVGEGQAIGVQTELVDALEKLITAKDWRSDSNPEGDEPIDLTVGGVLIDRLPKADKTYMPSEDKHQRKRDIQDLFGQLALPGENPLHRSAPPAAQFVNLDADRTGAKLAAKIGADVKGARLGPLVVENTLKTMLDAGQFEYLRLAGLPNDKWSILVEVHYVRARPKDMAGFHKDTQGQSLFVNLNYHVPGKRLRGPEYVLNPPPSKMHDELIYGTANKKRSLPKKFTNDLTKIRKDLPKPTTIESAGTVEGLGYVAFVDEAIHHATPWFGGRYVTPSEFKAYLKRRYPDQFDAIFNADPRDLAEAVRKSGAAKKKRGYSTLVEGDGFASWSKAELKKWTTWREMANVSETKKSQYDREKRYTRADFATTMPGIEFDLMLEDVGFAQLGPSERSSRLDDADERKKGGAAGWYAVSIPQPGQTATLSPVRPENALPLTRRASDPNLTKNWPKQLDEKVPRRFIRSWVRAVPKTVADGLRGS